MLDALGLRTSSDVDVAVSPELFEALTKRPGATIRTKDGHSYIMDGDLEVWTGWGDDLAYGELKKTALKLQDVSFVHPDILIRRKRERGLEKDRTDIALLEEYYSRHEK